MFVVLVEIRLAVLSSGLVIESCWILIVVSGELVVWLFVVFVMWNVMELIFCRLNGLLSCT